MKVKTKPKGVVICSVCLVCLMLCGCHEEQSYFNNKCRYSASIEGVEYDAQVIDDALDYVQKYSTERMKEQISRGELVIGMNQKEVLACLHATHFRDGVPVPSKKYNSKYGKYETWIVSSSSGGKDSSYSSPTYALDFTCFILTCIHGS